MKAYTGKNVEIDNHNFWSFHFQGKDPTQGKKRTLNDSLAWKGSKKSIFETTI